MKTFFVFLSMAGLVFSQGAGLTERSIDPVSLDSSLTKWTEPHKIFLGQGVAQMQSLFLFFPGTGAHPSDYSTLGKKAASLGYHVIGLKYPNSESINFDICGSGNADSLSYENARFEILTGQDRHGTVKVDARNSIVGRLKTLLAYLNQAFPAEGWDLYYANDQIQWSRITVSGQSQGGGHAGFVSKQFLVQRGVMFAAIDMHNGQPATWIRKPGKTPGGRLYGLTHTSEVAVKIQSQVRVWGHYGMTGFGPLVDVDKNPAPYGSTHMLTSNIPAPDSLSKKDKLGFYHNCLSVDRFLPIDQNGKVFCEEAWEYLLAAEQTSVTSGRPGPMASFPFSVFPNPARVGGQISFQNAVTRNLSINLFDSRGRLVQAFHNGVLNSGVYRWPIQKTLGAHGIYLLKAKGPSFGKTQKIGLLK